MTAPAAPHLRTIHLYGAMRDEFGPSYKLAVRSPAEAVRALCSMVRGFRKALEDGAFRLIAGNGQNRRNVCVATVAIPWATDESDFHLILWQSVSSTVHPVAN